jgi:hypothetical protein
MPAPVLALEEALSASALLGLEGNLLAQALSANNKLSNNIGEDAAFKFIGE